MMLKYIEIKNFQSYKEIRIDFTDGKNVIVGKTDSGKSAIIKAIYWVCFNRPLGNDFVSWWDHNLTSVKLGFSDGTVERRKSKKGSVNEYLLSTHKEPLKAGSGVPEPVSDFLKMNEINFHMQRERAFLLEWSPGEAGSFINKMTNLEIIDRTTSTIKKTILDENRKLTELKNNRIDFKKDIKKFSKLNSLEMELDLLEKDERKEEQLRSAYVDLVSIVNILDQIKIKRAQSVCLDDADEEMQTIERMILKKDKLLAKKEKIVDIVDELLLLKINKKEIKKEIKKKELLYKNQFPKNCPLCGRGV